MKDTANLDGLIEIFDRIEFFFGRLEQYNAVPMTEAMKGILVKIMVEVIGILGLLTKELKRGRASESFTNDTFTVPDKDLEKYLRKLIGRRDINDALKRLDMLTGEEARVLATQAYVTRNVGTRVETVNNQVAHANDLVHEGVFSTLATHTPS